jgi:nicotinic acid mononucleotide adenylyltransferase
VGEGVFARAQPHVVFVVVAGQRSNARMQHWQRGARNKADAKMAVSERYGYGKQSELSKVT